MADESERDLNRERVHHLATGLAFDEKRYEYDDKFVAARNVHEVHTTAELAHYAENDPSIEIEARVLGLDGNGLKFKSLDKQQFIESVKNPKKGVYKFQEGGFDSFSNDDNADSAGAGFVGGSDFIPLLGGPFNKQLYYYDYLRMHAISFHAFHHDPVAKRLVEMMVDFTLGRGYRVDSDNPTALATWRAFEKVNKLPQLARYMAKELSIYGETMLWELPNLQLYDEWRVSPGQESVRGMLPRYRLIDPSTIWEVITYPEDINRVLSYRWVAPTQYQIYAGKDQGGNVPTTKFIYRDLPADEVLHFKINCVSNEKRGRSDLFPTLGYLKRLRDTVNYAIIAEQKSAAWCLDTTIEGSPGDIQNYINDQQSLGTIAPAGSEFVHTSKVKREYLATQGGAGRGASNAFEWTLNMICAGFGVPVSYLGTHISGGQTRASALVSTEPVAKMFEMRQLVYEDIIKSIWSKLMDRFGIEADCEVTFPELISQDRSAKLKDLALAEQLKWLSTKTVATLAAKEFNITDYEYEEERDTINKDPAAAMPSPLTDGGKAPGAAVPEDKPSAVTGDERHQIAMNYGA